MAVYNQAAAFEKITDGIVEAQDRFAQWHSPEEAEEACNVYLLDPALNEGDAFEGNRKLLVADVRRWMADRLQSHG